jgi:hypothetical protein
MSPDRSMIFVLSDSTGNTAEKVVRAALLQFESPGTRVQIWPRIRSIGETAEVIALAAQQDALIVHTLVNAELREYLVAMCIRHSVRSVDLLGSLLSAMSDFFEAPARQTPGPTYVLDENYFRRVEAMEFSVKADDGQFPTMINRADVVLVGVSRTSKTPVSAYLAGQGYKVANVPLVTGIEPPPALFALPAGRVFALTIDPDKLYDIRQRRLEYLGAPDRGDYADRDKVFEEVRWALTLFRRNTGWPVIDVTSLAVEETATEILKQKRMLEARAAESD